MTITTITPTIDVTIGGQTRLFHAYITTADRTLDATATSTLMTGTIRDLAGVCLEPDALVSAVPDAPARLVLVDSTELAWQRPRYRHTAKCWRRWIHFWPALQPCDNGSGFASPRVRTT